MVSDSASEQRQWIAIRCFLTTRPPTKCPTRCSFNTAYPFVTYSDEPKKHPPDVTLKSQCYFDFLGSFQKPKLPTQSKELWILPHALELVRQNPILLIGTGQHSEEYGVPVNQLSLIYLVKEHWFAKNQKR